MFHIVCVRDDVYLISHDKNTHLLHCCLLCLYLDFLSPARYTCWYNSYFIPYSSRQSNLPSSQMIMTLTPLKMLSSVVLCIFMVQLIDCKMSKAMKNSLEGAELEKQQPKISFQQLAQRLSQNVRKEGDRSKFENVLCKENIFQSDMTSSSDKKFWVSDIFSQESKLCTSP